MSEYIYGRNTVTAYLNGKHTCLKVFVLKQGNFDEIVGLAKRRNVPIKFVEKKELDRMVQGVHQGVVLEIDGYQTVSLDHLMTHNKHKLIVLCDGLEDPHNLGAILRTCDAVGVDGVIVGKHRSVGLNATVAKVSTGAIDTVPVHEAVNLVQTLETLKKAGYWVVAAENGLHTQSYDQFPVDMPLVVVVGSEGKGISRLVLKQADILTTIPMHGTVNSLNVSVATAVLLYEVLRRR